MTRLSSKWQIGTFTVFILTVTNRHIHRLYPHSDREAHSPYLSSQWQYPHSDRHIHPLYPHSDRGTFSLFILTVTVGHIHPLYPHSDREAHLPALDRCAHLSSFNRFVVVLWQISRPVQQYFPPYQSWVGLCTKFQKQMSHLMTKPTMWLCTQRRFRSAWASTQSDQSLHCPHEERLDP